MLIRLMLILSMYFSVGNVLAHECSPRDPNISDSAEYLSVMAFALAKAKDQSSGIQNRDKKSDPVDFMVALKEMREGYDCVVNVVMPYAKSKNEKIAVSAKGLKSGFELLRKSVEDTLTEVKMTLDGKSDLLPGEEADRQSDRQIVVKKQWEGISESVAAGVLACIETQGASNKNTEVCVSKKESERLIALLKSEFKLPLGKGDQYSIDFVAQNMFEFLSSKWKFKVPEAETVKLAK